MDFAPTSSSDVASCSNSVGVGQQTDTGIEAIIPVKVKKQYKKSVTFSDVSASDDKAPTNAHIDRINSQSKITDTVASEAWIHPIDRSIFDRIEALTNLDEMNAFYMDLFSIKNACQPNNHIINKTLPKNDFQSARNIQELFKRTPKKAINQICGEREIPFSVSQSDVQAAMDVSFGLKQVNVSDSDGWWNPIECEILSDPLSAGEVFNFLKYRTNTAPGVDNITYGRMKELDPNGEVYAAFFNKCIQLQMVPTYWLKTKIVMIHKKPKSYESGDEKLFKKFRPISLTSCVYKTFAAILARRLSALASKFGIVSTRQRAMFGRNGVFENSHFLRLIMDQHKMSKRPLHIGFVDLADAFNSVPHVVIESALRQLGCPQSYVNIIMRLHTESEATIVNSDHKSSFQIRSGVKQGCPLSSLLFCIIMDPILRKLEGQGRGLQVSETENVSCLAYMDDILLITPEATALTNMFELIKCNFELIGMAMNPAKCSVLAINDKSPILVLNSVQVPTLKLNKYPYLGIDVSVNGPGSARNSIEKLIEMSTQISDSELTPYQKYVAITRHLRPTVEHALSASVAEWSMYEGCQNHTGENRGLEQELRQIYKKILHLPSSATDAFLYTSSRLGGPGFMSLRSSVVVQRIVSALRLLNSDDLAIRLMARESLGALAQSRFPEAPESDARLHYLNNEHISKNLQHGKAGFWGEVRKAKTIVEKLINRPVKWTKENNDDAMYFEIQHPSANNTATPSPASIHAVLNGMMNQAYQKAWIASPSQGRFAFCLSRSRLSNAINDSHMSFCDWRFLWKARLALTPVNGTNHIGLSKKCRKCGSEVESLAHVLNHCAVHSALWRKRHDGVQILLKEQISQKHPQAQIIVDKKFQHAMSPSGGDLRPDIIVDFPEEKRVHIIDVKCTIDRVSAWEKANTLTKTKYEPIVQHYLKQGYQKVYLSNYIASSLGSFCPQNWQVMKELEFRPNTIRYLADKCRRQAIHWSRNIWVSHCGKEIPTF
jgi:hypothetical protein